MSTFTIGDHAQKIGERNLMPDETTKKCTKYTLYRCHARSYRKQITQYEAQVHKTHHASMQKNDALLKNR